MYLAEVNAKLIFSCSWPWVGNFAKIRLGCGMLCCVGEVSVSLMSCVQHVYSLQLARLVAACRKCTNDNFPHRLFWSKLLVNKTMHSSSISQKAKVTGLEMLSVVHPKFWSLWGSYGSRNRIKGTGAGAGPPTGPPTTQTENANF